MRRIKEVKKLHSDFSWTGDEGSFEICLGEDPFSSEVERILKEN
jgi:hypothetical protein